MLKEEAPWFTLKEFALIAEESSSMQAWESMLRDPKGHAAARLTSAKEARMFAAYNVFNIRSRISALMEELSLKKVLPTGKDQFEFCFAFADVEARDEIVDRYRERYVQLLQDELIMEPDPYGRDLHAAIFLADARVLARETLDVYDIDALKRFTDILDDQYPFTETFKAYDLTIDPLPAVAA